MPQDRVPEVQARVGRGRAAAGHRARPHAHDVLDDGRFSTLDNQIDTQTGTVRAKARFANADGSAVPEPVRQRAAAAAHDRRRGRRAGHRAAPWAERRLRLCAQRRPHGAAARRDARRRRPSTRSRSPAACRLGERVITEGGDRLKDGARVQLRERPAGRRARGAARRRRRGASARRRGAAAAGAASGARARRRSRPARRGAAATRSPIAAPAAAGCRSAAAPSMR